MALVTLDADGQHDPAAVPAILHALEDADLVIGARACRPPMPWARRVTNRIVSRVVSVCAGQVIPDSQSGFRAMRAGVADQVAAQEQASRWGDRYEYETAALIHLARGGYRIAFVPVPTVYPDVRSHFQLVRDTARVVRTIALGFGDEGQPGLNTRLDNNPAQRTDEKNARPLRLLCTNERWDPGLWARVPGAGRNAPGRGDGRGAGPGAKRDEAMR